VASDANAKAGTCDGRFGMWWWAAICALVLLKLWLVAGQTIRVTWPAPSDDWLFLGNAEHLLNGEWLGPYNALTLSKGPSLSFFIATACALTLPLSIAKGLFYAAACVLMAVALGPLVPRCGWRFGLFVVLLFNPVTYDVHEVMRVWRQSLLPPLSILILAGAVGLFARREQPVRRLWPWSALLGLALSAFWLTREESVWILPSLLPVWWYLIWAVCRQPVGERERRIGVVLVVALALWAAGLGVVSLLNWQYYGVFTTCELKHGSFKAAYGSLLRVKHDTEIPFIPVPRETRERIYAVSPAFSELRPYLEGKLGEAYAANSVFFTGIPAERREIAGGWFVWAIREAVALSGHGRTGAEAAAYYKQLAWEVNDACDRGLLSAGSKHSGFLPPLRWSQTGDIAASMWQGVRFMVGFGGIEVVNHEPSAGTPEVLARFQALTHERLTPLPNGPAIPVSQRRWDQFREQVLESIHLVYVWVMPWIGAASAIALVAASVLAVRQHQVPFFLVLSVGCVGSLLAVAGIVALINVTSYPTLEDCMYLVGGYGLWILCQFACWVALAESLGPKGQSAGSIPALENPEDGSQPSAEQTQDGSELAKGLPRDESGDLSGRDFVK